MSKRVWVDVTLMMGWRGSFTGIQRVVYSYIKRLQKDDDIDARLFAFNGAFFEVSFEELEAALMLPPVEKKKGRTLSQRVKSLPNDIVAYGMPILKTRVREIPYIGEAAAASYKAARSTYRGAKNLATGMRTSHERHIFADQDTVLLIDGNWGDNNAFAKAIVKEKETIGFQLAHIVHDIVAMKNAAYAARQAAKIIGGYFNEIFPHVDTLLTISRSTMNDVESYCKANDILLTEKREVIRLGDGIDLLSSPNHSTKSVKPASLADKESFILTVGTIEVRKNHHLLYYIYKLAHERKIHLPNLVVVGRKGWMSDETIDLIKNDNEISDKITVMNNASDAELRWLYSHCQFTVFPSFYEGWGLPVVESLNYGKFCISSNTSSLPEAGGDLVAYASPYDPEAFLKAIVAYTDQEALTAAEAKVSQYKAYSWDDSYSVLKRYISA